MLRPADALCAVAVAVATGAAYAAVLARRLLLRRRHPLGWPADLEMVAAGFRASLAVGNLATLRLFLGALSRPLWLHRGLRVTRAAPPGCEPSFWLELAAAPAPQPAAAAASSAPRRSAIIAYVHGGAFVSGDPLMCVATFRRWLRELRDGGVDARVLAVGYPLAPERPYPAAVASVAAALCWAGRHAAGGAPGGPPPALFVVGDSAGGNIAVAALAALRDARGGHGPRPAATRAPAGDAPPEPEPAGGDGGEADSGPTGLQAALEARLFADLRARLEAQAGPDAGADAAPVRMPSAVVLVSPAVDIGPAACFRDDGGAADAPHWDYLPRRLEAGGMASYAEHHEALAGPFASPAHLPSLADLTTGRFLVLSGGVEILAADINRFVGRLRRELGPGAVVHAEQRSLPHSWAIIPTPGLAALQRCVPQFLLEEAAAAAAGA